MSIPSSMRVYKAQWRAALVPYVPLTTRHIMVVPDMVWYSLERRVVVVFQKGRCVVGCVVLDPTPTECGVDGRLAREYLVT